MRLIPLQLPLPLRLLRRVLLRLRPLLAPSLQMLPVYAMTALMRPPRAKVLGAVGTKG